MFLEPLPQGSDLYEQRTFQYPTILSEETAMLAELANGQTTGLDFSGWKGLAVIGIAVCIALLMWLGARGSGSNRN